MMEISIFDIYLYINYNLQFPNRLLVLPEDLQMVSLDLDDSLDLNLPLKTISFPELIF